MMRSFFIEKYDKFDKNRTYLGYFCCTSVIINLILCMMAVLFAILGGLLGIGELPNINCDAYGKDKCIRACECGWCGLDNTCIKQNINSCNGTLINGDVNKCDNRNQIIHVFTILFYISISVLIAQFLVLIICVLFKFSPYILKRISFKRRLDEIGGNL